MTTTCLGCGCDDHNACHDGLSAGCHWLTLDVGTGTGICSACPELLKRWQDGCRDPLPEFTELRVYDLLKDFYDFHEALQWFLSRQPLLNNAAPHDLVVDGRIREVRQVIDQLRDGVLI